MTSQRKFGGTGLGLVISKSIIRLLGGDIQYFPQKEGKGSIFKIDAEFEVLDSTVDLQKLVPLNNLRALIVDDTNIGRRVIHAIITSWKMRNGQYSSGPSAIEALLDAKEKNDPYQIAIIDYQMPEMNGVELARKIRERSELNDLCMILLTSVDFPEAYEKLEMAGFSAYLQKPITSSDLLNTILRAWNQFTNNHRKMITQYSIDKKLESITIKDDKLNSNKSLKILLVDDSDINLMLLQTILENMNLDSDVAMSGTEAIALYKENKYDVIFMDIEMPELSGIETLLEIKKINNGKNKNLICIATTAHALEGSRENFLKEGFTDYIPKPITMESIKSIHSRYLREN